MNLRNNSENVINVTELLKIFVPEGKPKYVETLLRIMKKTRNSDSYIRDIKRELTNTFDISPNKLDEISDFQMIFFYRLIDTMFNQADIKAFQKFCEYNERGLIADNDLSKYTNFEMVMSANSLAEIKTMEKDLEKQVIKLHNDNEWVVLRPLTFLASRKYGSSTKWCTASENNPEYFLRYSKKGILVYVINKLTGLKVAAFKSLLKDDPELSFWNQTDSRVDSMETTLPTFILEIIRKEFQNELAVPNMQFLSEEDRKIEENFARIYEKSRMIEPEPADMEMTVQEEPMMEMSEAPMEERAVVNEARPIGEIMSEAMPMVEANLRRG